MNPMLPGMPVVPTLELLLTPLERFEKLKLRDLTSNSLFNNPKIGHQDGISRISHYTLTTACLSQIGENPNRMGWADG